MATGIVQGEKLGADALLAEKAQSDSHSLPDKNEAIELVYSNKMSEQDILAQQTHRYLRIDKNGKPTNANKLPSNGIVLADNFFGLHKLLEQHSEKVQLIYMDPPYGTGMDFQSRSLKHAYKDVLGTAPWLEFIRRRMLMMRELLAEDGSIYVHIGHQMLFHLKIIMDEIFGSSNFRNLITRKKCSSKNYTKNQYPNLNDYILFYSKTKSYKWNMPGIVPSKEWITKEYPKTDNKGRYKLVPIHAPGVRNGATGEAWRGMMPPPGKHWQMTPSKLEQVDARGEMHWSKNGNPRRKVYLTEDKEVPLTDYWDSYRDAHHQSIKITGYPTEKNLEMLKKIILASSDEGDLVLDPFCGSGTTLHAANDLSRSWIGIDQSFTAISSSLDRLRNGLRPMGDYVASPENPITEPQKPGRSRRAISESMKHQAAKFKFFVDSEVFEKHRKEILELAKI